MRLQTILALVRADARNMVRDPILVLSAAGPVLLAVTLRVGLPIFRHTLLTAIEFDLAPHYPLIASLLILFGPWMVGALVGLVVLDEREDRVLMQLGVTPLLRTGYLLYRLAAPLVAGIGIAVIAVTISGLPSIPPLELAAVAAMAGLGAPVVALALGSLASNRVEGLALSKGLGVLFIAPLAVLWSPSVWDLLAGPIPVYWVTRAFLAAGSEAFWPAIAAGTLVHTLAAALLLRVFARRAG